MKTLHVLFSAALLLFAGLVVNHSQAQSFTSPVTINPSGMGATHIPYSPNGSIYLTGNRSGGKAGDFRFRTYNGSYQNDLVVFSGANGSITTKGYVDAASNLATKADLHFKQAASGHGEWLLHHPNNGTKKLYLGHRAGTSGGWNMSIAFHPVGGGLSLGTQNLPSGYRLAVDGKVMAEEVTVQLSQNWPDYVFEADYNLLSLAETEAYINKHQHLPGLPSAADVAQDGIDLAEMNALLLEKIEELTLHTIQLQKEVDALKNAK